MLMYLLTKAEIIAFKEDRFIRTVSNSYPYPSVIRLSKYLRIPYKRIELSRKNIHRRDGFRCQYCGEKNGDMTIDHIVPKSRGGVDSWDNLVTACRRCNNKKGSRTPQEVNMTLLNVPSRPHHIVFIKQFIEKLDENWRPFLFMD